MVALWCGSPVAATAQDPPHGNASPAATIVGRMGIEMRESAARHGIGFEPFTPPRVILTVALLPPFRGDDTRKNRGIGFEYSDTSGRRFALAQWPVNGGTLSRFEPLNEARDGECADAHTFIRESKPNGVAWTTPHGLIMTLQADGRSDWRTVVGEWHRLVRRGACK